jgi:hypothetical protein
MVKYSDTQAVLLATAAARADLSVLPRYPDHYADGCRAGGRLGALAP